MISLDRDAGVPIRVASLETLQADGDAHLRSADFFDAERYPVTRALHASGD
jgi:polyisoprenoid-binding protein YceI